MNETLPNQVDAISLCKKGVHAKGEYPLSSLEQLQGKIVPSDEKVQAKFIFMHDSDHLPIIEVHWEAVVRVLCERCLSDFDMPLKAMNTLCVVESIAASKLIPEGYEPVVIPPDSLLSVHKLLSEEILLSLPLIIRHEDTDCSNALKALKDSIKEVKEEKMPSPFDKLNDLVS